MSTESVSVVIAWVNPFELIVPGLKRLTREQTWAPHEVIVVSRHSEDECRRLRSCFQTITVITAPPRTPITSLRSMGLRLATGGIVAVTEDHCIPSRDWIADIARNIGEGYDVVGGPVENDCTVRWRDWAAFLTEYAGVIRPKPEQVVNGLPGNNVAYRHYWVGGLCRVLDMGRWESFYHSELQAKGARMLFDRDMPVFHRRPFNICYFIRQRYYFCRSFAAMRGPFRSLMARSKYGFGSALLPPLLLSRGLLALIERRRLVARYLACLPLIATYITVGAFGEMAGYCFGSGDTLRRVE